MRFTDFLRVSVLLFGGSGTVLALVSVVGAVGDEDQALVFIAIGWWVIAAAAGLWLGRRLEPTPGIARLLAGARATNTLPEVEPGAIIFNRLWPLAVATILAGAPAFLLPHVPAMAAGFAIAGALTWRRQASGVQAIEERDGARFYFDRTSPFGAPKLLRTPGLRKIEPAPRATAPTS